MSSLFEPNFFPEEGTLSYYISQKIWDNKKELTNQLLGRILTLIDASIADTEQRKAMKDIARVSINDVVYCNGLGWLSEAIAEYVGDKEKPQEENNPNCSHPQDYPKIEFTYSRQPK